MKILAAVVLVGALLSAPIFATNFLIKCPTCGKMMVPNTWHKCEKK